MKIAVCSDLHLELGDLELKNTENADVLILSGDIFVAHHLEDLESGNNQAKVFYNFIDRCCSRFCHVIMVMGNHEHYHGDFAMSYDTIKSTMNFPNFHLLDVESMDIDGVTFVGGTLWTDMNKEDPITLEAIGDMMNDFRIINNSKRMVSYKAYDTFGPDPDKFKMRERPSKFSPTDTVEDHHKMMQYLKIVLENNPGKPVVVVGHHAPTKISTHPRYKDELLMNGAYSSDLSEFILDHPEIKLWTHGHTHEPFDYSIGGTRVVCNPRGYIKYEDRADQFELKFLEI